MVNTLYDLDTIESLEQYLRSSEPIAMRKELLSAFDKLTDYQNIKEWNQLVRIFESLAIIGWGDKEPLEAHLELWLNGAYYTHIRNQYFEQISCQSWVKKGDSYILDSKVDTNNYGIKALSYQRNPLPKYPFRLTRIINNAQQSVKPLLNALTILDDTFNKELRPQLYGKEFSYLVAILSFSNHDDEHRTVRFEYYHSEEDVSSDIECNYYIHPRIDIGKLSTKKGEVKLKITRYFTKKFGYLHLGEQKQIVATDCLEMVDILKKKLEKKKSKYNCDLLKSDMEMILNKWMVSDN